MKHLTPLADSADRAAWLEARKPVITATQISAIVGSNPYQTIVDVWNEKTDPDWQEDRSVYLDTAAAYGNEAEGRLVDWASTQPAIGGKLRHNTTLFSSPVDPTAACTPDAWRTSRAGGVERLIVVDAKTASKDWMTDGVPQYIVDQMLWTWWVTGCHEIYLAVEHVKRNRRMEVTDILGRYLIPIPLDDASRTRLAFLQQQATLFLQAIEDGIAPASIIDIRLPDFDTDPDDIAAWQAADAALSEIAAIDARTAADVTRRAELVDLLKSTVKAYAGQSVELLGTAGTVTLSRFWQAKVDYSSLDQRRIAAATTWQEQERVVVKVAKDG